jgi:hypothetical protein
VAKPAEGYTHISVETVLRTSIEGKDFSYILQSYNQLDEV